MHRVEGTRELVAEREGGANGADASGGFEAFFRTHHERLLRAMYLVTGSAAEAEDLTQEAFLKVWERWERVERMDSPEGYLYRTAMNLFRSRVRRAARAAKRLVPGWAEASGAAGAAAGAAAGDPAAIVDDRDAVMRGLRALSPRQRAAVVVTELLGYGSEESARVLGVRPRTVSALATQGRAAMRRELGETDE